MGTKKRAWCLQEELSMQLPVNIRCRGSMVYVRIGLRTVTLKGIWERHKIKIYIRQILFWDNGTRITKEEKSTLIYILTQKSRLSPWMRLVFVE